MEPGEIVRSVVKHSSLGASEQLNIVYHILGAASAIDDGLVLDGMTEYWQNLWGPAWTALGDENSVLEEVTMQVIGTDGLVVRVLGSALVQAAGTGSVGVTAAAVSAFLLLRTAAVKSRATKYIPGLSENVIDNGVLTAAGIVASTILAVIWQQNIDIDVVFNAMRPGLLSLGSAVFREFTGGGFAEDVPAYQKRRKPGVGT